MEYIESGRFGVIIASQYSSMVLNDCELICDIVTACAIILISSLALRLLKIETELREEKQKWQSSFSHWRTVW
jgi:hypothetical protein